LSAEANGVPVSKIAVDVRIPHTSNAPTLGADGRNSLKSCVIAELDLLLSRSNSCER